MTQPALLLLGVLLVVAVATAGWASGRASRPRGPRRRPGGDGSLWIPGGTDAGSPGGHHPAGHAAHSGGWDGGWSHGGWGGDGGGWGGDAGGGGGDGGGGGC